MSTIAKLKKDIKLGKKCVAHWLRMRTDPECKETPQGYDCPYCCEYGSSCRGCPIRKRMGATQCEETPFYDAKDAWFDKGLGRKGAKVWQHAATAELNFLRRIVRNLQAKLRRWEKPSGK
ncbi:hypothetical protein LCGC14_2810360 [marine sediment metagenome]|uniref:Uncharacterized protein n=1 Tax=marine sediment metagenome TaxID=412755 RepID=A0A0F8YK15_9ZZZZ